MRRIKWIKYTFLSFLLINTIIIGQSSIKEMDDIARPFIRQYSYKLYKGDASNWSVMQDKRGVVYFGNTAGIIEYDGRSWRNIIVPNTSGARTLALDSSGTIYASAYADFGYLKPDSIGNLEFASLVPNLEETQRNFGEMWDVAATKNEVFFKSADKVFRWKDKKITVWDSVYAYRLYNINDVIYSRNQDVGLMLVEGDSIKLMPNGEFFADIGVFDMLPFEKDSKGKTTKILVTTNSDGLFIHDGKKVHPFKTNADAFLKTNQVYNACITADNNIALATQRGGVIIIDKEGKLVKIINEDSGLSTNVVYDVYSDYQGGLWLATGNGINYCEEPSPFSIIKSAGDFKGQSFDIIRFEEEVYLSNDFGVLQYNDSKKTFELLKGSNKPCYFLLDAGEILIASTNWGVATVNENHSIKIVHDDMANSIITSKKYQDRIYAGFYGGFSIFIKKNKTLKEVLFKEFKDDISAMVEDNNGGLWLSSMRGDIYRIEQDELQSKDFSDNGPEINIWKKREELPGGLINLFSIEGEIILSTEKGLFTADKHSGELIPSSILGDILSASNTAILQIKKSHNNDFWVLAEINGVPEMGQVIKTENQNYEWNPIIDFRRLDLNSILNFLPVYDDISSTEKLWINTEEGIVIYNPENHKEFNSDFSAVIRRINVKNDSLIYAGSSILNGNQETELPFSFNDINFEFSSTSYDLPENTLYQYFLEGDDEEWSKWTKEYKKEYTNLSYGNYTFYVRSKNVYGMEGRPDSFSFIILPPWYLTWWAYLIYAFLLGVGIFIVDRIQRARLISKERDRAKLREAELIKKQAEELETVDRLVRVINKADNLDTLFESLINRTISLIPQAEKASIFLLDKKVDLFRVAYVHNYNINNLDKVTFTPHELKKRYTDSSEEIEKGIYILSNTDSLYGNEKMSVFNKAKSLLVMAVEHEGFIEAYVVFDSFAEKKSFDPSAARILNRFREHAVSAISKAKSLQSLQEKNDEILRTQEQLVMQQKLASLGALTAGIAHEIKNPLNFVNNFAEVSSEMVDELSEALKDENNNISEENAQNISELIEILEENLVKINNHGKRADSIIKGMLLHSRGKFGEKAKTNINDLLEQYVNLAYHGLRAQNKEFNITIHKDYDQSIEEIDVIPQDISRVFLNLINNACYAATERKNIEVTGFNPILKVSTKNLNNIIEIRIRDNGTGIPENIRKDIFNPFFTTKPTGKGTGLGLSISYDIIVKGHGGSIDFDTKTGEYTEFIIGLPK